MRINDFEDYLRGEKGITVLKPYKRNGSATDVTLCTYVRHQIHHPENIENDKFSDAELKQSIELLIHTIKKLTK